MAVGIEGGMAKNKKKRDPFPHEIYAQHNADIDEPSDRRDVYLSVSETEEQVFDEGCDGIDFEPGERVGVYRFVEVVKLTKKVSITRKKAK